MKKWTRRRNDRVDDGGRSTSAISHQTVKWPPPVFLRLYGPCISARTCRFDEEILTALVLSPGILRVLLPVSRARLSLPLTGRQQRWENARARDKKSIDRDRFHLKRQMIRINSNFILLKIYKIKKRVSKILMIFLMRECLSKIHYII